MKWIKRFVLVLLTLLVIGGGWLTASGYQRYKEAIAEMPLADKIEEVKQREDYMPLDQISPDFVNAVVAVEDRRFYTRQGIDVISLGRALLTNLISGELKEGGSTIPQQLAKNLYFTHKPSLTRKIAEVFFLYDLEAAYSKDEILSFYVNVIYYGDGHYGIAQASRGYFNKGTFRADVGGSDLTGRIAAVTKPLSAQFRQRSGAASSAAGFGSDAGGRLDRRGAKSGCFGMVIQLFGYVIE